MQVCMRGTLKVAYRLKPRPVASAWYSQQSNPEDWESVSGDLMSIHAKLERQRPLPKKPRPFPKATKKHREPPNQQPKANLGDERVFGLHPVLLALRARRRVLYELYVGEGKVSSSEVLQRSPLLLEILNAAKEQGLSVSRCSNNHLKQLCSGGTHQGVCLDASKLPVPLGDSLLDKLDNHELEASERKPLWLYMDRVQDPMNFGAVLRSSCYFGVQKVFAPSIDSCRPSPTVSKASSGALEMMEMYTLQTPAKFLMELKARGWWIVGTSSFSDQVRHGGQDGGAHAPTWDLPPPDRAVMLIVGNEGQGMLPEVSALCDSIICVAPYGGQESPIGSLNVSVAAGIVLHHLSLARQSL
uniref:rRNA methyltransferase 1, mitochondrial n=1 Tax=Amblyomma maculatum TaxID=34609 RepID=G3MKC5_AMBMU